MFTGRRVRVWMWALAIVGMAAIGPASSQVGSPEAAARERLVRLDKQLQLYRDIRARHQRDDFFRVSHDHARQLAEDGLDQLRKFEPWKAAYDVLKAAPEAIRLRMEDQLGVARMSPANREAVRADIKKYIDERLGGRWISAGSDLKTAIELTGKVAERYVAGKLGAKDIDNAILAISAYELAFKKGTGALLKLPGNTGAEKVAGQADSAMSIVASGSKALLYAIKATQATSPAERDKAREEALKESLGLLTATAKLTEANGRMALGANAKLAELNADVYTRLFYWAGAQVSASRRRHEASRIQSEAISQLNYKILVTQYEIDKAQRALRIAERRAVREPGGIKLNNVAADAIAARLDIKSIGFDAVSGKVVIEGAASRHAFDLDVFQTVLRLAVEEHEPFFSLSPVNHADFDTVLSEMSRRIYDKYQRGGQVPLIRRLTAIGLRMPLADNRECYFADLARFDPDIHREVLDRYDDREERIYSPEWLRYTRVGRILYEADLHIKSIVTGYLEVDGEIQLADVWAIPGFRPSLFVTSRTASRANLELDAAKVMAIGGAVDLSAVKPKLVFVARKPGTSEDLPPTPEHLRVAEHFDANWQAYVERVPSLAELMAVYRAYVAARYLSRVQPRLKQQILDLGEPGTPDAWPLYHPARMSMAACVAGGRLVPLRSDGTLVEYGGALSGGTSFKFRTKIEFVEAGGGGNPPTFSIQELRGRSGALERGGRTALIVDFDSNPLSIETQWHVLGSCLAAAFGLGGLAAGVRRLRKPLELARPVCLHCAAVHRRIEGIAALADLAAVGSLSFIVLVPFLAAAEADAPSWEQALAALGIAGGTVLAAVAIGYLGHRLVRRVREVPLPLVAAVRWFGAGSRWLGLALAAFVLFGAANRAALDDRLVELAPDIAPRLLLALGDLQVVGVALLILAAAGVASIVLRWGVPWLLRSRPALLGLHIHEPVART